MGMFGSRKTQTTSTPTNPTGNTGNTPAQGTTPVRTPVGYETVIGANTSLKGDLSSHANVRIDGHFEGGIHLEGNIMVGEAADIHADIHANNITISGAVHGNVFGNKVQVTRNGRIWGDINAATLNMEEGAFLDGKISMANHPAAKGEQPALSAPEMRVLAPTAEDANSGEPLEVELVDDTPSNPQKED